MGTVNRFLRNSPNFIQSIFYDLIPFGNRYGKVFKQTLKWIDQGYSHERQKEDLRDVLYFAASQSLFYKVVSCGNPHLKLSDFPIMTKDLLRANIENIAVKQNADRLCKMSTSGSTGQPLFIYADKSLYEKEAAYVEKAYQAQGTTLYYKPNIWIRRYVPEQDGDLVYYNKEQQRLYMSAYHLTPDNIKYYVNTINDFKSDTISTYPSAAYIMTKLMEEHNLKFDNIKYIHCSSEQLPKEWAEYIHLYHGLNSICSHYGQMEKASFFYQFLTNGHYYEMPGYGHTEIIDGRMVCTSLLNFVTPIIRYDIGDYAELCDTSEYGMSLCSIQGRQDDLLMSTSGNLVPSVNFYTLFYKLGFVKMFKIVQTKTNEVEVDVVLDEHLDVLEKHSKISEKIKERLGNDMRVLILSKNEIGRSYKTGKIRCIENRIGEKNGNKLAESKQKSKKNS